MGGRMLKHGLAFPERNLSVIEERLDFVAALVKDSDAYDRMAQHLYQMVDIERIVAKIATQKISPRPGTIGQLNEIDQIKAYLSDHSNTVFARRGQSFMDVQGIITLIQSTLNPGGTVLLSKGEVIADKSTANLTNLGSFKFG